MMEYAHLPHHHRSSRKYASSTMSAETLSGSCGSRNKRVRTVRLVRRSNGISATGTLNSSRHAPCMGFSVRGGYEHGTGLFVSHVESGSEAYVQGLKVGDQIIRINGFTIEDAVHKEVIQLLFSYTHLTLKVRDVGMIPVKEKKSDALSWQIISDTNSSSRSSPQFGEKNRDVRINIFVAARSKLGCGICKGPDWKPGIFVQFTKEGGIAREAGLRPGDQILQCNNVDFADIPFNEAVNLMKTSRQLELMIRKAAATELFPGESSGYNSSASSVTEDQNPAWADPKRLSIVKEENHDLDERMSNNKRISHNNKWTLEDWEEIPTENKYFKPTIINLSENGTTIKNNGSECKAIENHTSCNAKSVDSFKVKQIRDTQTVVEVHRSDVDDNEQNKLSKSPSISSFNSLASSSLSSAITMEIQRRVQKQATKESGPSIEEQIQMKKVLKGVSSDQQHKHNQLMNEFIQAHQKMFKCTEPDSEQTNVIGQETMDRLVHKDLSQKLSNRLMNLVNNTEHKKEGSKENTRMMSLTSPPPPPPPPPSITGPVLSQPSLPTTPTTSGTLKPNKTKPKAPPVPVKHSILSTRQPPPCPTPDYDTLSISSSTSSLKPSQCNLNDAVEMESLDSFNISHPTSIQPKPPNNYFQKRQLTAQTSNSSISSASIGRPKSTLMNSSGHTPLSERPKSVSVTIGEYAGMRTQPGRLDFLRNEVEKFNGMTDELTQTLNRSNLRKRTESMDNLLGSPQIKPQSNGTVRISLKSNLSKEFTKSTSDLTEDFNRCTFKPGNRVMINVNQDNIYGSIGGILKNS